MRPPCANLNAWFGDTEPTAAGRSETRNSSLASD
jgi:hypothetical protein